MCLIGVLTGGWDISLKSDSITLSDQNTTAQLTHSSKKVVGVLSSDTVSEGVMYWEMVIGPGSNTDSLSCGVIRKEDFRSPDGFITGQRNARALVRDPNVRYWVRGKGGDADEIPTINNAITPLNAGDRVGLLVDLTTHTFRAYINDTLVAEDTGIEDGTYHSYCDMYYPNDSVRLVSHPTPPSG